MTEGKPDILIVASWEVANKVGGIYTVLSSKAPQMMKHWSPQGYLLVGPYLMDKVKGEFQEAAPLPEMKAIFQNLAAQGLRCHWGHWLIAGEPQVILLDFEGLWPQVNHIKAWLWENFQIDSLGAGRDFEEPTLWAYGVGKLIEKIAQVYQGKRILAHFHEWLAGAGLLYLKKSSPSVKTVFTTHATFLGRALAGHGRPLYEELSQLNPDQEAYSLGIQAKHLLEKSACQKADVLTTVSAITSLEIEKFFERKPDILLPNGLDISLFPTFEEASLKHRLYRDHMRRFLLYYFLPHYDFDVRQTLFYFISGRYEFRNKGINILIQALNLLNQKLKEENYPKTIVTFFWVPALIKGIKPELIEARELFSDFAQTLEEDKKKIELALFYHLMTGKKISRQAILEKDTILALRRKISRLKKASGTQPPIVTHELVNENDLIVQALHKENLTNKPDDKVKVIYYPTYLTGSDGVLNLEYKEAVQGAHLGIFPSYYEPWGYTPLETAALGVAAIASDLSGFGQFIAKEQEKSPKYPGIWILSRSGKTFEQTAQSLAKILYDFGHLSRGERVENKIRARKLAEKADWQILIKNYQKAYQKALA